MSRRKKCKNSKGARSRQADALASMDSPANRVTEQLAADAMDDGDAATAYRLLRGLPYAGGIWGFDEVAELAQAGDSATPWMWGRFACGRAFRWAALEEDPRITDLIHWALVTMYQPELAEFLDQGSGTAKDVTGLRKLGALIGVSDGLVEDAMLFERGILRDYLEVRAGPGLVKVADMLEKWPLSTPSVYRLDELRGDRMIVTDLRTDRRFAALHTGEAVGYERDALVLGRLVPMRVKPRRLFVSRPIGVDMDTASQLLDSLADPADYASRWSILGEAGRAGRMLGHPGIRVRGVGLASAVGLCPEAIVTDSLHAELQAAISRDLANGRTRELESNGYGRTDAEGISMCEFALWVVMSADSEDAAIPVFAHHCSIALSRPSIYEYVRKELTDRFTVPLWTAMAGCVHGPARDRFLALATLARRSAA